LKKFIDSEIDNIEERRFYVYALRRPDWPDPFYVWKWQPFYIGKGFGKRMFDHRKEAEKDWYLAIKPKDIKINIIHKLLNKKLNFIEEILFDNLTEQEAFEIEIKLIAKYGKICDGTGCLANLTDGGEGASAKNYEKFLSDLKDKHGDIAYDLFVNYLDDPLITQADISEYTSLTREGVRYFLKKIHGDDVKKIKLENSHQEKLSCYPSNLQGIIGDKLREERIRYKKKYKTIWECENNKTFTVKKLVLHKESKLYILTLYTKTDYIITSKDNNVYLIPFPNSDVDRIYLHYPQDLEQYKDFTNLRNLDLDGNEKELICKFEFDGEEPINEYIPYGYCQCGCGQKTNIIKTNNKSKGRVKGEPYKYISGHNKNRQLKKLTKEKIQNMIDLFNQKISIYEIANLFNITYPTVLYHLRKNNIISQRSSDGYSFLPQEFICSVCEKTFIKKRKPKEMICLSCKKDLT